MNDNLELIRSYIESKHPNTVGYTEINTMLNQHVNPKYTITESQDLTHELFKLHLVKLTSNPVTKCLEYLYRKDNT